MITKLVVIFYILTCMFIYNIFTEIIIKDDEIKNDNMEGIMCFVMFIFSLVWIIALPLWIIFREKGKGESV